ncbi:inosine 5'-monophosphate dehydrogenase [Escherichia coli]|uniref:Inosine 5'-monophosphate dehydrogenase n=1 Tax=Escherichia coli TaxID=562 RepID=A0A3S4M3X6_ECOLX|nr:inosine 5'-monophosphate dehydrogenase [Escherichia coli]
MTPKERLVTVREGEAREVVLAKMHEKRVEKALVVDDEFHLIGMITVKDFQKAERKPNACKDEQGRLRVGAAVGAGAGNEERVDALVAAGVDVLLIDSSTVTQKAFCSVSVKLVLNIRICKSSAATWQQLQVHALWQKLVAARLKSVSALVLSVRLVSLLA